MQATEKSSRDTGEIRSDVAYLIDTFLKRAGLTKSSLREARRKGFRSYRIGNRTFVHGADFLAFITQAGTVVGSEVPRAG
ncbi:MAG: hypothetical protein K8U03_03065 [Planctomycetia bacterium]|nr:hypothetical protein [Planctomycetia bacterium]